MFIPLMKADAAQRLVYGCFDETPDRAGEICDYATAKPAFESWSAELSKASDGKSLGNIRGQHSNIAAGKLTEITFDDDLKKVGFVAKIVDDNEWRKVEEGVYTGFSPGGRYAKRWQDGAHRRYTPDVRELSIVDVPCNPAAGFTMVKADGAEEQVGFVIGKAYEPGNAATIARAETLAKTAGGPRKDFVGKARADLIAENAEEALAKMAAPEEKIDPVTALDAVLAKANKVAAADPIIIDGPEQFRDLAKAADALRLLKSEEPLLEKGLYTVRTLSDMLQQFSYLQSELCFEAKAEGDNSPQPTKAAEIMKAMGSLLITMVQEEVAELLSTMPDMEPSVLVDACPDVIVMELATSIVDLVKADTALMEKAGARNSKGDATKIQSMHDNAVALGADCGAVEKDALSAIEADRDRLAKAVEASVPKVEQLTEKLEKMAHDANLHRDELAKARARIEELEKLPEPPKGKLLVMEKADDGKPSAAIAPNSISAVPEGRARSAAIEHAALQIRAQR